MTPERSPSYVEGGAQLLGAFLAQGLADMRRYSLATEQGRQGDRQFHSALLHATRNDVLIALSAGIAAAVAWTTVYKQRGRELPRDPLPFHMSVYEAIAAGEGEGARQAMQVLVTGALEDITFQAAQ